MSNEQYPSIDELIEENRGKTIEEIAAEPWDGPHLITRDMLLAAGAIKDRSTMSKPRGGKSRNKPRGGKVERDLFSDLVDDDDQTPAQETD